MHSAIISQGSAPCQVVCWLPWVRQQEDTALPELTVCWRGHCPPRAHCLLERPAVAHDLAHVVGLSQGKFSHAAAYKSHPMKWVQPCMCVCSAVQPHGLQPVRLLWPWDSPGKNTGVGCHSLLQGNFLHLPHWQANSLPLALAEKPWVEWWPPTRKHSERPRNCECDQSYLGKGSLQMHFRLRCQELDHAGWGLGGS